MMKKFKLGITGGIGSGKSYVSAILARYGIPVYDTDSSAKRLMVSDGVIRARIVALFGEEAYQEGDLNKPLLAEFIFSDSANAARINAIVHPRVHQDFEAWALSQPSSVVGMESAILFESGFERFVDKVLMVSAPLDVRVERAMQRDGATRNQIMTRIKAQMGDEEKLEKSDFVIVNDEVSDVETQIGELLARLRQV